MSVKILVVDDEPGIRKVVQLGLETYPGIRVDTAADRGAVELARETAYDLILTDMHLSEELDGLTIIEEITKFDREVRFVVMTGKKRLDVAKKLVTAVKGNQVASFLFKPFELEELHIAVTRALEGVPERNAAGAAPGPGEPRPEC